MHINTLPSIKKHIIRCATLPCGRRGWTLSVSCFFVSLVGDIRKSYGTRETAVRKLSTCACLMRPTWSSSQPLFHQKSSIHKCVYYFLVEEGGFGPPKRNATDLQSAPFGHSGTLPFYWWAFTDSNRGPTGYEPVALTN